MKQDKALRLLGLAGLGALMALPALAQDAGYYYGGLSVGQSRAKIDQDRITAGLLGAGLTSTAMTRDEKDTAYKVFGGYQFNRYIGLEGGYFNLGRFGFTSTTLPAGTLNGEIKLHGLNLDLVGTLPLSERWSALGRVGVQYAQAKDQFSGTGAVSVNNPSPSKREANGKIGAGLQYAFSPSFLLRVEAERYRINDAVGNHGSVNVASLSLVFPFGRAPASAPRAAAAPVYVETVRSSQTPPPPVVVAPVAVAAPVPAIPPAAPERRRVSFKADSLFGFDHAEVRPDGKAALDQFARQLAGTRFDIVTVEGHTDRLGSTACNQKLSAQRADAVKAYLASAGGLDSSKISAVGKGETQPVTRPGDCVGNVPSAKLIACLQPDRRVEVDVTGTR